MKKLFTLLTLLVAIVTGAWGATNTSLIDGISLPSLPAGTYTGGTDVTHNGSNKAVVADGDGNSVMQAISPSYGSPVAANFTWTNAANDGTDASWSTTGTTWEAPGGSLFVGSTAYTTSDNAHYVNFARRGNLRTNRTFAYRFTNCAGVSALVKSNGNTDAKAACLAVYEVGANDALTHVETASSKTAAVDIITVDDLSSSKTYVAYIYGMNGSNGELYEVAFLAPPSGPRISASPTSVTLAATESGVAVNGSFTITGSNLTAGTYNLTIPSVTGLGVSPTSFTVDANGTVSQEVTLSYSSTENVPANTASITASVDDINLSVAVNYSASVVSWTLQTINSAKTWDFTKLTANTSSELYNSSDKAIKLSDTTNPTITDEFVYENYKDDHMTIASDFDGTTLAFKGQFPSRNNTMCQNGTLHFKTSVPGTITVDFSDTGSSVSATAKKRYLNINGTNTIYFTSRPTSGSIKSNDEKTTDPISVEAGDVFITGMEENGETPIAICVYEIVFTPTPEPATPTTEGEVTYLTTTNKMDGWRAFYDASSGYTLDNNTTAYVATAKNGSTVTMTPLVGGVPAGTPVILKTTSSADNYKMTLTKATVNAYEGTNLLEWTTTAVDSKYRLGYGDKGVGFYPYSGTPASGAVILNTSGGAKALTFVFSDPTGISSVSAKKAVSTGKRYNLSGQLVGEDYKGIVIENGKKFNQ